MSQVVVISGHPDLKASYTNTVILDELRKGIKDVNIRKLDALYPNFNIDTQAEQYALKQADIIVLQFPYYWYSVPALMKKWMDDVFTFNFAYGPEGDKLKNKHFILSFTVGGPEQSYGPLGYNHFTIEEFMRPLQQTAYLAGMQYQDPIYTHRMVYIPGVYNEQSEVEARARDHASRLISKIEQLTNSAEAKFDIFAKDWFEKFDQLPEDNRYFVERVSEKLELDALGDKYLGTAGFNDWYKSLLNMFKSGVAHHIEQISLKPLGDDRFDAELRVRVQGELTNGESLNQLFNEHWQVSINDQGQFVIDSYKILSV